MCQPDRVHLRSPADELVDGLPRRLVFKLPKHFLVVGRIVWVVGGIVGGIGIELNGVLLMAVVDVGGLDAVAKPIGIGE